MEGLVFGLVDYGVLILSIYTGIGFDVHRLVKKRKLYLSGIKIPFDLGLEGHSDADPVLHAIIDSLPVSYTHLTLPPIYSV